MKEFPYERAAMNNDPMPDGLDHIDMAMYQALASLYWRYHAGGISRDNAKIEKGKLMHKYNVRVNAKYYEDIMYRTHFDLMQNIEGYSNNYAKARASGDIRKALEAADKMYELLYAMVPKAKEIPDEQLRMEVKK